MEIPWTWSSTALDAAQAAMVALPAAGLPRLLARFTGKWWALIPPLSIVAVVYAITALPGVADGLTWLALIACPPLAAFALGWAMHGARPVHALAAVPLLAAAIHWNTTLGGHLCALALTALSTVTLARLLAGVSPRLLLKLAVVAMAVADAYLILSEQLQKPNAVLVGAAPAPTLPRLQVAIIDPASMGYGDLFLAAVLGAIVALEARRYRDQLTMAAIMLVLAVAFDGLFLWLDSLPATVPVAVALGIWELGKWPRGRRARMRGDRGCGASPDGPG
jgi:hypothetical protein